MLNNNFYIFLARAFFDVLVGISADKLTIINGFFKEFIIVNGFFYFKLYSSILA